MIKKTIAFSILICMLCVSISGAGVSVNNSVTTNGNTVNEELMTNKATDVNAQLLKNINREVDKYLNFGEYIKGDPPKRTVKEIEFPWHTSLQAGDFVDWIIYVNYKEVNGEEKHFQETLDIDPATFRETYLNHAWDYKKISFDTNEDGTDDLDVYYSIFFSTLKNTQEGIGETKSVRSCLRVRTEDMLVRNAKLEVWSEIRFNWKLIKENSASDSASSQVNQMSGSYQTIIKSMTGQTSSSMSSQVNQMSGSCQTIIRSMAGQTANTGFSPLPLQSPTGNVLVNSQQVNAQSQPIQVTSADDNDWLALGMGVISPEGKKIPNYFEKYFNVAKDNIFAPIIFEQELHEVGSQETLGLLYGFQAGHENQNPSTDVSFEIDFDPAIFIRTQFIPRSGYVYYYYNMGSACSKETSITFTTNGFGADNVELSLIFDNTNPIAEGGNWMSFDVNWLGFKYKANKKHTVSVLLTSPSFSAKLKLNGIPTSIDCSFDVDLSFTYQHGHLLDVSGTGTLVLTMSSKLDSVILYYPELSSNEPKVEFVKITGIPSSQSLNVYSHLYVHNDSMTTLMGEGYVDLTMNSNLNKIQVFYRKADPNDPDKLFIDVPQGIPASNRVSAKAELYIDLDDFSNPDNYVYANAYRTASGVISEISGYLPGETEPIVRVTQVPSYGGGEGKLEWNKLKGYAYASRSSPAVDPIEINVKIGTFKIYNFLQIGNGHINCDFYLNEDGYFGFDTSDNMIGDIFKVTDTSTGNKLTISAANVSAHNLWADWNLDLSHSPIQVEELALSGALISLENFVISATYQGKNLSFNGNWKMGQEGIFSVDFHQDEPIELILDDLFPNDPCYDLSGGVIISENFHFDMKWKWKQGVNQQDPGYFKINEDTSDPNFDWIEITFTYDPSGSNNPKYGIEIGGTDVGLLVWAKWWKDPYHWLPMVWWYVHISGSFYANLLWEGVWYDNIQTW